MKKAVGVQKIYFQYQMYCILISCSFLLKTYAIYLGNGTQNMYIQKYIYVFQLILDNRIQCNVLIFGYVKIIRVQQQKIYHNLFKKTRKQLNLDKYALPITN